MAEVAELQEEQTLADLIRERHVTSTATYGAPYSEEFDQSDPWTVTLRFEGRRITVPFYMGYGLYGKEPTTEDVLDCLLSDASLGDVDFEEFCGETGYDLDSRKAEKLWKSCARTTKRLHQFLGDAFQTFSEASR